MEYYKLLCFFISPETIKNKSVCFLALLLLWGITLSYNNFLFALTPPSSSTQEYSDITIPWSKESNYQNWLRTETKHFVFIFEEKNASQVDQLLLFIKKISVPLQKLFQHYIKDEKVHVIIDGRSGTSNSSFHYVSSTIQLKTHPLGISSKHTNWMEFVFIHEFAHYLHLNYPSGMGLLSAVLSPKWLSEGLAVYIESYYSNAGRLNNPFFTLPMRANILLDTLPPYSISQLNESFEFQFGPMYLYGSFLFHHIIQEYDFDTFISLWQDYLQFPLSFDFDATVKEKLGRTLSSIHNDMKKTLFKKYYAESGTFPRGTQINTQIHPSEKISLVANTDTGLIYYKNSLLYEDQFILLPKTISKEIEKNASLEHTQLDNNQSNTLQKEVLLGITIKNTFFGTGSADVSKDGTMLVFSAITYNTNASAVFYKKISYFNNIYLYSLHDKKMQQLSHSQQLLMPNISNDASFIIATKINNDSSSLIKINVKEYQQGYELLYRRSNTEILEKDIAPTNTHVAFIEKSRNDGNAIRILEIATKRSKILLLSETAFFYDIRFIDTNTLQFSSDIESPGTVLQLYRFTIDSEQLYRVAQDSVGIASALPTDNNGIVYLSNSGKGFDIYHYTQQDIQTMTQPIDISNIPHLNTRNTKTDSTNNISPNISLKNSQAVWSFFPNHFAYWHPTIRLKKRNGVFSFYPGIKMSFLGSTNLSNFTISFEQYIDTIQSHLYFQPIYQIAYKHSFQPFGDIFVSSSRNINYISHNTYLVQNQYSFAYGKYLWHDIYNNTIQLVIRSKIFSRMLQLLSLNLAKSYALNHEAPVQEFSAHIAYKNSANSQRNLLSWSIELDTYYQLPLKTIQKQMFMHSVTPSIRIPLAEHLAIKIRNKNIFFAINYLEQGLKSARNSAIILYTKTVNRLNSLSLPYDSAWYNNFYKSIWAFDAIIPINYNDTLGNYLIQPYAFFLTLYSEHSYAINTKPTVIPKSFYDIGFENNITFNIAGSHVTTNVGALFHIPYSHDGFEYKVYFYFILNTY